MRFLLLTCPLGGMMTALENFGDSGFHDFENLPLGLLPNLATACFETGHKQIPFVVDVGTVHNFDHVAREVAA